MSIFKMKSWFWRTRFPFILAILLVIEAGCGRSDSAPAVVPVEQLAAELGKAFHNTQPETGNLAGDIISSLNSSNYSQAYLGLQKLADEPGLTKQQGKILVIGMLTVNQLLQSAQSQGDQNAAQVLQYHRATK
jgi:hypothetical protein